MNYEELVNSNGHTAGLAAKLPLGFFRRTVVDGKAVNRIQIRRELLDSIGFVGGLNKELERNGALNDNSQLHFHIIEDGVLEVGTGSYRSLGRVLAESPAVVGHSGFVDSIVGELLRIADYLHSKGIYHICFAPENVFVRSGDNKVMLLSHGSFYFHAVDPLVLYKGFEEYVAPEVLNSGTVDERCDIYSIGKFLEYLFTVAEMPYEYKAVVAKATREMPEDRYSSVADMRKALSRRRAGKSMLRTFAIASVIAVAIVGGIFGLMSNDIPVEFVQPVATQDSPAEILDEGFDHTPEPGAAIGDTMYGGMSPEQQEQMKEYEAKCEKIFRKMYAAEAERILSKIYNSTYMGSNEKKFMAGSKSIMNELIKAQEELAGRTHLSEARSQRIASEIIDEVSERKKAALTQHGIQKVATE
ncbi:MAG: hypothetical protein K2G86_08910 [Prevotella sp.]|nr:hypothetical protein [Prevotella sp.]